MPSPLICVPCEKGNHLFCMGEVMDVATSNMVPCECGTCDDNRLRVEQTYGGERRGRDYT